ncbi:hypothetical protein HK096_004436, partial [Nowakowskiella sp. JEL0078]
SHRFDHPWDTITIANYRKYPNAMSSHVLSVDILSREVDPTTGLLVTERLLCCKQSVPPIVNRLFDSRVSDVAYFREISVLDPTTRKYIARSTNLSLRNILTVEETCTFEADPLEADKTVFTQRAAFSVGNSSSPSSDSSELKKDMEQGSSSSIEGAAHLKAMLLRSRAAKASLPEVLADVEGSALFGGASKECVASSWRSVTEFVEDVLVSRFRANSARGRQGLEMVVEKVSAEARGFEDRLGELRQGMSRN